MAGIDIITARNLVANCKKYEDSPSWKDRVMHMPEYQIWAIYYRMLKNDDFNPKKYEKKKPDYIQPTLFDFGMEVEGSVFENGQQRS